MAKARRAKWPIVLVALASAGGAAVWTVRGRRAPYYPPAKAFAGDSRSLQRTIVVPTLDSALPPGKSAIWCIAFQSAWRKLKNDVVGAPIEIVGAESITKSLNAAVDSDQGVDPADIYAAAGFVKDGIIPTIHKEMAQRFPTVPAPQFSAPEKGAVAYSYLSAEVKFAIPFFENGEPFLFADSSGGRTSVSSFGIRARDEYAYHKLRNQVRILYLATPNPDDPEEFALDLDKDSLPNQIILARVPVQRSLLDAMSMVETKIRNPSKQDFKAGEGLGPNDTLLIPNIFWEITHDFSDLEGTNRPLRNKGFEGFWLGEAVQAIRFKLDRSGVELASEAKVVMCPVAFHFAFNRPFLVYMKRRGNEHPFFAMWVDNAEVLSKRQDR